MQKILRSMKKTIHFLVFILEASVLMARGNAKCVFYFIDDGMYVNQLNGTEMFLTEANEGRISAVPL